MDKILRAMDKKTAAIVFDEVIMKALAGKTRVLATNDVDWLARSDRIVLMKDGRVHAVGTYAELRASNEYFNNTLKQK